MKRGRYNASYNDNHTYGEIYSSRRKQIAMGKRGFDKEVEKDPFFNGITNATQRQNVCTATAYIAKTEINSRKAKLRSGMTHNLIPTLQDEDSNARIFFTKTLDPLFTTDSIISTTGLFSAKVFGSLNGMNYSNYPTSEDCDYDLIFSGLASADYGENHLATDMVPITLVTSGSLSTTHTGYEDIHSGWMVGFKTPYWDKMNNRNPDVKWVQENIISAKTSRVVPRLTRITPFGLTDSARRHFTKLILDNSGKRTYFPTAKHIPVNMRGRKLVESPGLPHNAAIGSYNMLCSGIMAGIITLAKRRVITGVGNLDFVGNPGEGKVRLKKFIEYIAFLIGFYQKNNQNGAEMRRQKEIVSDILAIVHNNMLPQKTKHMEFFGVPIDGTLRDSIVHGYGSGMDNIFMELVNVFKNFAGRVVKGGRPKGKLDIDFTSIKL